jgi:hypothetical protein
VRAARVAFPRASVLPPGGGYPGRAGPAGRAGELVAVADRACHREAVEPSAVAARRMRASLALAVVGAIVLMTGVALVLTGEAIKLEHHAHPPSLIGPGLVLAFLGLALGASAAVTILLDAPTRLPAPHPLAAAAPDDRSAFGPPPAGPAVHGEIVAGEVLSSARLPDPVPPAAAWTEVVPGAALSPPGRTGPAFAGPPPPEVPGAREPVTGEVPGYSDAGWGAGTDSQTWPDPPPEPPQEIHHPVRR